MVTKAISSYIISLSALLQEVFMLQEVFQFTLLNWSSKNKHMWAFLKSKLKEIYLFKREGKNIAMNLYSQEEPKKTK